VSPGSGEGDMALQHAPQLPRREHSWLLAVPATAVVTVICNTMASQQQPEESYTRSKAAQQQAKEGRTAQRVLSSAVPDDAPAPLHRCLGRPVGAAACPARLGT
jgi:hypothetical protein